MRIRHLLAAAVVALAACGDAGAPDEVVYGVAVYTQKTAGADFAAYNTYYLDPQIKVKKDGQDQDPPTPMPADVKAAIDAQMTAGGYTAAPDAASADLGLSMSYVINSVDYYSSGGYCDIYYGWYGCYYPPVYAGSYRYGTAFLTMTDLTVPPAPGVPFPGLWFSTLYGVVADFGLGSASYNTARLVEGLHRAFDQSPYLGAP